MMKLKKDTLMPLGRIAAYYGLAFILAIAAGLVLYAAKGLAPFGDQSVLCMDMWGQYFPMYEQNATADSLSEFLYSWNGAFGYNSWAANAYYYNSIFLLILPFFSTAGMVTALNWICLVKLGCSAVTCLVFLTHKLKKHSPLFISGAVVYGLCAYMLAYLSQPMWTDALIYAPLVLLGLERLIHEKKPLLYMGMLALTMISSFYIGFALCIFLAVYYICMSPSQLEFSLTPEKKLRIQGRKAYAGSFLRFAGFSVLAAAVSAFVLIPVAMAVGNTIASEATAPEGFAWYGNITAYLQCLLPEQRLYLEYEGANLAVGTLVFLMIPLYFFNKKISTAERIGSGVMLVFLFVSMNANVLSYIWHGFHFPNQLPGRWTFLLSLFLVQLCCTGLSRLKGLDPVRMLMGLIAGAAVLFVTCCGLGTQPEAELPVLYLILLLVAAVLLMAVSVCMQKKTKAICQGIRAGAEPAQLRRSAKKMQIVIVCCTVLLAGVQVFDRGYSFVQSAVRETGGMTTTELPGYAAAAQNLNDIGEEWKNDADTFYRGAMYHGFTFNPSMMGDYSGMSHYSSTMNGAVYSVMRTLGNRVYAENVSSIYNAGSPIQDSLFGIRYYYDTSFYMNTQVPWVVQAGGNENYAVWENPYALSAAYAVSPGALNWEPKEEVRSLRNQNEFLSALYGEPVEIFRQMETESFYYENLTLQESANWEENYFLLHDGQTTAKFYYTYVCQEPGTILLEHNYRAGTITVTTPASTRDVSVGNERFCSLGYFNAGDVITIDVVIENVQLGCCGLNLYRMDDALWQTVQEKLASQQLLVEHFENTKLTGTITMAEQGLVMATIPQDGGWKVYCDDAEVPIFLVGDALIAVSVPAGTHTLRYEYSVPGLGVGLCISIGGLLLAVWLGCPKLRERILDRFMRKQTDTAEPAEEAAEKKGSGEAEDSAEA